ncbi:MAG TPA: hypothetical protein VEJ44_07450 [Acidimicrobiales bacterium]|nr:hypothetical protein [Acidimicrobiales bacterium]
MAHRIEVELTSKAGEAAWTWRAAGARQPRGTVEAGLVPDGAGVGTVLRAEVETTLDGTVVTALMPLKVRGGGRAQAATQRIEVTGTPRKGPDVNVVLSSKTRRRDDRAARGDDGADGDRRPNGRSGRRPRRDVEMDGGRPRGPRAPAGDRGDRGEQSEARGPRRRGPAAPGAGRDVRRPAPSTVYRNAALAELRPEELPVAEQLVRGGIPAVRQAIDEQNARARADGRPEVTPGPLLAMAERLLPALNVATWKDRASVARNAGKDVSLRELRSIVAAAQTVTLDDEGREMAATLRTTLDQRVTALREGWVGRIAGALDDGRVLDAVRASVRPPEPSARLSAELAVRLAAAASAAMSSATAPDQWLALLGVVVDSPVRRTVKPSGLPAGADETLLAEARKAAGYVPELARLLGIPIPPPPGPRRPVPARAGSHRHAS